MTSKKRELNIGDENEIQITLDQDKDPTHYYAVIAVPSNLSIRQTDDLLSDYKGRLIMIKYNTQHNTHYIVS